MPKDCDEQILSKIIRRQDQFPPPICVVSRVKYVELDLGIDEKIGFQVKKYIILGVGPTQMAPLIWPYFVKYFPCNPFPL